MSSINSRCFCTSVALASCMLETNTYQIAKLIRVHWWIILRKLWNFVPVDNFFRLVLALSSDLLSKPPKKSPRAIKAPSIRLFHAARSLNVPVYVWINKYDYDAANEKNAFLFFLIRPDYIKSHKELHKKDNSVHRVQRLSHPNKKKRSVWFSTKLFFPRSGNCTVV